MTPALRARRAHIGAGIGRVAKTPLGRGAFRARLARAEIASSAGGGRAVSAENKPAVDERDSGEVGERAGDSGGEVRAELLKANNMVDELRQKLRKSEEEIERFKVREEGAKRVCVGTVKAAMMQAGLIAVESRFGPAIAEAGLGGGGGGRGRTPGGTIQGGSRMHRARSARRPPDRQHFVNVGGEWVAYEGMSNSVEAREAFDNDGIDEEGLERVREDILRMTAMDSDGSSVQDIGGLAVRIVGDGTASGSGGDVLPGAETGNLSDPGDNRGSVPGGETAANTAGGGAGGDRSVQMWDGGEGQRTLIFSISRIRLN